MNKWVLRVFEMIFKEDLCQIVVNVDGVRRKVQENVVCAKGRAKSMESMNALIVKELGNVSSVMGQVFQEDKFLKCKKFKACCCAVILS